MILFLMKGFIVRQHTRHSLMQNHWLCVLYMRPAVTHTTYATSSKGKTGDIITFAQFEEGNLSSVNCNDAESGDKYYDNSIMPPLLREEEMDAMDSGDKSDDEPLSTKILE